MFFAKEREAWNKERLQLLTQISDLQAMNAKLQEDAAKERLEVWAYLRDIIRPNSSARPQPVTPPTGFSSLGNRFPGSRPNLRPSEAAQAEDPSRLPLTIPSE